MKLKFFILIIALAAITTISALDLQIKTRYNVGNVNVFLRDINWKKTNNAGKLYKTAGQTLIKDTLPDPGKEGMYFIEVTKSTAGDESLIKEIMGHHKISRDEAVKQAAKSTAVLDQGIISLTRDWDVPNLGKPNSPATIQITPWGTFSCSGTIYNPSDDMGIPAKEEKK